MVIVTFTACLPGRIRSPLPLSHSLQTTRAGAETALASFDTTAAEFGLTVSATKTQFLVAGRDVSPGNCAPIELAGTVIESVSEFRYLGSLIHRGGRSTQDITARIAHASRACGALQRTIFGWPRSVCLMHVCCRSSYMGQSVGHHCSTISNVCQSSICGASFHLGCVPQRLLA